ncbi:MAG TPA: GAF domain-containing protein [Spirochaetota bacterium]|nr:GAF domain-containing protein [Spirochaetota bacterium]
MKYRLTAFLFILAVTIMTAYCSGTPAPDIPSAKSGFLDLRNWDFHTRGIIELKGNWEFYRNQLLTSEDFSHKTPPRKTAYINVPDSWDNLSVHRQPSGGKGYGTYRLTILTNAPETLLGMRFRQVFQAAKIWINGDLLSEAGTVGTTPDTMRPERSTRSIYFQPRNRSLEIIVQMANYHHRTGGMRESIEIGLAGQIQKKRDRMLAYDLFIFGGLFIIMLYHLGLYLYHRKDIAMLFFGILSLVLALRALLTSEIFLTSLMPALRGEAQFKIEYISFYLTVPLLAMFYNSMYKSEVHPVLYKGIIATGFLFSAFVTVTPLSVYNYTVIPYSVFFAASFLYMIAILSLASYRNREGALMLLLGFLILFATAINDLLHNFNITQSMVLSHFGFLIFVIIQSMVLSKKYALVLFFSEEKEKQLSAASSAYLKEQDERKRIEEDREKLQEEITSREKIQRELTKSETKYRALFDTSPQGIVISTLDGKILEANNAFMKMLKYSTRELQDMTWKDFTPEKWHNIEEGELIKLIKERVPITYEKEYIQKDGQTFAISLTSWLISGQNDEPAKIFTIISDITERKHAEENLLLDESRLEALLDLNMMGESSINEITDFALEEGVRLTKSEIGYLAFLNEDESVLTMHTWSRLAVERCNLPETQNVFLVSETGLWGEAVRQRKPVITNNYDAPNPLRKGLPEGHTPLSRHMNVPVFDGRKIVAVAGVGNKGQDYNDSDVRQLTLIMQGMWRLIQRKNHEEELIRARKIESLGILAGGIAHDFNNLLTIIYGNLSLAKLTVDKDSQNYILLTEAEKASLNAKNLTRQLLTFSKGGAPIKTTASVENLLRDTVNFVLSGSNVRAVFSIPENLRVAHIDEGQISQVIHNLVINSRQAMPEGGTITVNAENIALTADATAGPGEGDFIKIEIIDEGSGIPEEIRTKIFDPYFTTKDTGSGLGLAVCYSIVKNHGGYISAQSGKEKGTIFTLHLPAAEDTGTRQEIRAGKLFTGTGKILVMDDDPSVLKITQLILEYIGYEAVGSCHGEETVSLYREAADSDKPFDAVIMDLTIPGKMGGARTIQKLREIDPGITAIVASGYSNDPIMARYGEYGFAAVLAKPYRREELGEVLNRVLKEKNNRKPDEANS